MQHVEPISVPYHCVSSIGLRLVALLQCTSPTMGPIHAIADVNSILRPLLQKRLFGELHFKERYMLREELDGENIHPQST